MGPSEADAAEEMDQKPRATPRLAGGNSRVIRAMPTGMMMPAPRDWTTLKKMRLDMLQDMLHRKDPTVNRKTPPRKVDL